MKPSIRYSLASDSPGLLTVDSFSGQIMVNSSIDREEVPLINITGTGARGTGVLVLK